MTDIALRDVQIIWSVDNPELASVLPAAKLMKLGDKDDRNYFSSWGACNSEFNEASDSEQVNMLMRQFVQMTAIDGIDAAELHGIFMDIPEYRKALADFGAIEPVRED